MADGTAKPVIFISYSHKDEPERTPEGDIHWLNEIQSYLAPAVNGVFELWTDEDMTGGADWEKEIKEKLAVCDICVLFVSRHSLASKYVIEVEITTILERQRSGHSIQIYPIVLSPFPEAAAPTSLLALNLRPRFDKPLSGFSRNERGVEISKIADEIVGLLGRKPTAGAPPTIKRLKPPSYVHIAGLPETGYEHLVGRETALQRLDDAWADSQTNILSLIAEGGAGKSALVNEWLKRLQADNYRGAEVVLGWSFYSQGTKERATSADEFLNWALGQLGIKLDTTSATAKGEAIAEAMMRRRVLLVLDGVEPLQHGLDAQLGQLKDQGLRSLLRRFAATPPAQAHGLIVLTSRVPVKDIVRWRDSAAPVIDVERLSDEAGAALLRDNGVWGTDKELKAAAHDFDGHPLALGLLASFLKETQFGDVRRRDHIRAWTDDPDNPRHNHAKRVMESYEKEWLSDQPALLAILYIVGLFDRPAKAVYLKVLREYPPIAGFPHFLPDLDDNAWNRAISRLRDLRLLAPAESSTPDLVDAHPLIREWFGNRFHESHRGGWRAAHGRIYECLRDQTNEGQRPTIETLAPLYQAVRHGCLAGRHSEVLDDIYRERISRRIPHHRSLELYATKKLGTVGSELAAFSWFFDNPYKTLVPTLNEADQVAVERMAAFCLRAQGRFAEVLPIQTEQLDKFQIEYDLDNRSTKITTRLVRSFISLAHTQLLVGNISDANATVTRALNAIGPPANLSWRKRLSTTCHSIQARILFMAGQKQPLERLLALLQQQPKEWRYRHSTLVCDILLSKCDFRAAHNHATEVITRTQMRKVLLDLGQYTMVVGRANLGLALNFAEVSEFFQACRHVQTSRYELDDAADRLRAAENTPELLPSLLARAALRRTVGDWDTAARDLNEVEEIAEPGPMRLQLCDMGLDRARLAFAKIEAFAPLNGMLENDNPPKPIVPSAGEIAKLKSEAEKEIKIVANYIEKCGYHRRDEELAELQAVLRGEKKFADLPPRV